MFQFLEIPIPDLFSLKECLWFLDRNYDDCLHEVRDNSVRKLLKINQKLILIEVFQKDNSLIINVLNQNYCNDKELNEIIAFVKKWLDLERNIQPFYELLKHDAELQFMISAYAGLRLISIPDLFEALSWSIIGQQINLTFAYKLKRRLVENYGESITFENKNYWLFPEPKIISKIEVDYLRNFQFSERKAEYLIEIAKQFSEERISTQLIDNQATNEAIKTLTGIRGIGEWTANYALMKSLKRLECITYGDVGLYNALAKLKGFPKRPSKDELTKFFANFKGWEAYLVYYLWRSLASPVA